MHKLTITGASDDLIEIDGDIREEFTNYTNYDDDESFLSVSDGTLLRVVYDGDGIWRFTMVVSGRATMKKTEGVVADDTFDIVELTSEQPFAWIALGKQKAISK